MSQKTLPFSEVKSFYNNHGIKQDRAKFEEAAFDVILSEMQLDSAESLFEFGCGTGRVAVEMLELHLSNTATYRGVDVSETMIEITQKRLARFGERANVQLSQGGTAIDAFDSQFDRVFSTFVLDLLPLDQIDHFIHEAWRVLQPSGLLGVAGLTHGATPLAKVVEQLWMTAYRIRPRWVGGCRPLELQKRLNYETGTTNSADCWQLVHHEIVTQGGLSSEVLIVRKP